jgi:hypothetical protein
MAANSNIGIQRERPRYFAFENTKEERGLTIVRRKTPEQISN